MNRVINAIARMEAQIASKNLPADKLAATHRNLDMGLSEYCRFQELKSLASTNGTLTLDEAQTVYCYLGNTPEHFNEQPLAAKAVLTQLFAQLLQRLTGAGRKVTA